MSSSTTSRCGALCMFKLEKAGEVTSVIVSARRAGERNCISCCPTANPKQTVTNTSRPQTHRMKPHSAKLSVMLKTKTEDRRWSAV